MTIPHARFDELEVVTGAVRLIGAHIGGQLSLYKARLGSGDADRDAIVADRLHVEGNIIFNGVVAPGVTVRLTGAHIDESLIWNPAVAPKAVNLEQASCRKLQDLPMDSWPADCAASLDGFSYATLADLTTKKSVGARVTWLSRQTTYSPQPYQKLRAVYRDSGHEAYAQKVGIEQHRKRGSLGAAGWLWNIAVGGLLGHGYRLDRPLWLLAALITAASVGFSWAGDREIMVAATAARTPASTPVGHPSQRVTPVPSSRQCQPVYPCYQPIAHAAGVAVPVVRIPQADAWRPDPSQKYGWWIQALTWFTAGAGWVLATFAVIGVTGLARKE